MGVRAPVPLYWRDAAVSTVETNLARLRLRLTTNDLGTVDADPTVRPGYPAANPYQLRHRGPTVAAIEAVEQWLRTRLTSNDLGLVDSDPTIKLSWSAANPYTLRLAPSAIPSVEAMLAQIRLWSLHPRRHHRGRGPDRYPATLVCCEPLSAALA